jgi:hypothetical protein
MIENSSHLARLWRSGWLWLCAALTTLKIWLVGVQTVCAIAPAPGDDELFVSQAEHLLKGEWLGPLTDLTLVKGPIYPLWLAVNHLTRLPLLFSQALLYTLACAILVVAVRPQLAPRWARALVYLAVLFNPGSWADGPATRVIRDGFYSSLTLLLLASAAGLALRLRDGVRTSTAWAAATGVIGATVAMTREEGLWLAPSLVLLVAWGLVRARRAGWRALAVPAAIATGAYLVPVATIAAINRAHYGVFTTCEMTVDYFRAAYGALTRVKTKNWQPLVPVPEDARRQIYAVSPAFREAGPSLEASAPGWTTHGCKASAVCDDIAGGWFVWAFRGAATAAGKYRRGGETARDWYEQVTQEIDDACRSGALDCLPARASLASPWRNDYLRPLVATYARAVGFVATFESVSPRPSPAQTSESDLRRYEEMTLERIPLPRVHFSGQFTSRARIVEAVVLGSKHEAVVARIDSRELATNDSDPAHRPLVSRYMVETNCGNSCLLFFTTAEGSAMAVPIAADAGDRTYGLGSWRTESFDQDNADAPSKATTLRVSILDVLTRAYRFATPALLIASLLLIGRRLWLGLRARVLVDLPVVALALLGAVVVRLLLLSLISVSAFPAVTVLYCAPTYPLYVASVAMVLASEAAGRKRMPLS